MPRRGKEVLRITEEFRKYASPRLGGVRITSRPLIPPTKTDVKELLDTEQPYDEHMAPRRLGELGSAQADILLRREFTREVVTTVLSRLRARRSGQVSIFSIFRGTRFKYLYRGALLQTWCPNTYRRRECGSADASNSLLTCCSLRERLAKGPEAIDFLILAPKRIKPQGPTESGTPIYRQADVGCVAECSQSGFCVQGPPDATSPPNFYIASPCELGTT